MSLCWAFRKLPSRLFSAASAVFGVGVKRGFPGLGPRFMRGALFVSGFRSPVVARSVCGSRFSCAVSLFRHPLFEAAARAPGFGWGLVV